jgi:E3 ubiquitin-protein ligase DOA10
MVNMTQIFAWLRAHDAVLWWLGALSLLTFVGTLILIPLLVVRIPADYFRRDRHPPQSRPRQHVVLRVCGLIVKNLLGIVFIVAGLIMLLLPGQGVLTILIGLTLMNFPGKHALERWIVRQPAVLRAINWIRAKAHQPALEFPAENITATAPKVKE